MKRNIVYSFKELIYTRKSRNLAILCTSMSISLMSCSPAIDGYFSPRIKTLSSSGIKFEGPIKITKGGTYTGNWESGDPDVPAVTIQTSEPVIIENSNIRGRGDLIFGFGNRLTVRHTSAYGLNPNISGRPQGNSIVAADVKSLNVENNYFEGTNGIYIYKYTGKRELNETIKIVRNEFRNINGRPSAGAEKYFPTPAVGKHPHAIQFNQVQQISGVDISWNQIINDPFNSLVEENINFYISSGTTDSPILVHDNYVQGAYNSFPDSDSDYSGGGILLGDGTSDRPEKSGNVSAYNNQIVGTSNEGMAIAGGVNNKIYGNRVISSGRLPDGRIILSANVGIYMWDHLKNDKSHPGTFGNNVMRDNYSAWGKNYSGAIQSNSYWGPDCLLNDSICENNISAPVATLEDEANEYKIWVKKINDNGMVIGNP